MKFSREAGRAAAVLGAPVTVIRNGIPPVSLPPVRRAGKEFVIGTAARLSPDKRLDLLLEAFRLALPRLPACRLRIAGGAESRFPDHPKELRKLARGLPVEWCGDCKDMPAFLAGLDLFAMISEPAGCPNASLEAMSAGLPVVATDHGGVSEQVIDGITGRLVGRNDVESFAEALVSLAHDESLRRTLGAAGQTRVHTEFSMARMVESYEQVFALTPPGASA